MIYIPLKKNPPPQKWLDMVKKAKDELAKATTQAERHAVIDKYHRYWSALKAHLESLSYKKCWYSEAREIYSHYHVDHFRPKKAAIGLDKKDHGGYWWLAFDWENYRICGSVGNTIKGDDFAVLRNKACNPTDRIDEEVFYLLDPIDEEDPDKISFQQDGMAVPMSPDNTDWDYKRAEYTIEHMELNYGNLIEARKQVWADCENRMIELENLMKENNANQSIALREKIKYKTEELRSKAKPHSPLSATAKVCLLVSGKLWAQRIATSIHT